MAMSINNVSGVNYANQIRNVEAVNRNSAASPVNFRGRLDADTVEFSKEQRHELTTKDKQEIKHKARNNATGWSVFGGLLSTAYYALRSDKTVAKKYDLDIEKDKDFIKEIKKDQTLWTLPAVLGLGVLPWIYSKCQDASDMTIKSERA